MLMKSAQKRPQSPDSDVDSDGDGEAGEGGDDGSGAGADTGAGGGAGAGGARSGASGHPVFEHVSPEDEHEQLRRLQLLMVVSHVLQRRLVPRPVCARASA